MTFGVPRSISLVEFSGKWSSRLMLFPEVSWTIPPRIRLKPARNSPTIRAEKTCVQLSRALCARFELRLPNPGGFVNGKSRECRYNRTLVTGRAIATKSDSRVSPPDFQSFELPDVPPWLVRWRAVRYWTPQRNSASGWRFTSWTVFDCETACEKQRGLSSGREVLRLP